MPTPPPIQPPVELPLLESACTLCADACYYAARPLLRPATQTRLARRAIKAKSSSNVRIANASYSSLFFDPAAHSPLTPLIVEGDAQALIFGLQRVSTLVQRMQQLVKVFDPAADTAASILQVFQGCALDLAQVVAHARSVVCKAPLLLCGTAPNLHLLLEVRDWAMLLREKCAAETERIFERVKEAKKKESAKEEEQQQQDESTATNLLAPEDFDDNEVAVIEAGQASGGLLFSDCGFCPPETKRDLEKAERWLLDEELPYLASGLKELVNRWSTQRAIGLLACYGSVVEQPAPGRSAVARDSGAAATIPAMNTSRLRPNSSRNSQQRSSRGRSASPAPGAESPAAAASAASPSVNRHQQQQDEQHEEDLHQLQLSFQRIQLFLGQKKPSSEWMKKQQEQQGTDEEEEEQHERQQELQDQLKERFQEQMQQKVPDHVANSVRFTSLSPTDKMEILTTLHALGVIMHRWRRWLKKKKDKAATIDSIMRKNAVIHCMWRFRVWKQHQEKARAERRATYGRIDRGKRVSEYELSHSEKGVQTMGGAPKTFLLRLTK